VEPYLPRIDIHTHILPGLDDGPFTLEDSIAMAHATALDGTTTIVATPHSRDMEIATSSPDKVNELADLLNTSLRNDSSKKNVPTIKILTGMCNHLTSSLPDQIDLGKSTTLNRTRFLLIEPPFGRLPIFLEDVISRLLTQRLVPVLAHPERNIEFQRRPNRLQHLVEEGAVVQIAAGSLTGKFGNEARKAAEQFVLNGIAHVVASEMHANKSPRSPILSDSFRVVSKLIGEESSIDLFETNPEMLLEGRLPQQGQVKTGRIRRRWIRMPNI